MSSLTSLWILAPILLIAGVNAQRCHVCVPGPGTHSEVERLFPGTPLLPCHTGTEQRLCPPDYRGCLTQTKGGEEMRTCAQFAIQGCRSANGVEYCYCMGELCNAPPPPPELSDDEDLPVASGAGPEPDTRESVPRETAHTSSTPRPNTAGAPVAGGCSTAVPWLPLLLLTLPVAVWR